MIEVVKLEETHIEQILAQEAASGLRATMTPKCIEDLTRSKHSFALISATGRVLCCAGIAEYWANRGEAWVIFAGSCRREFISIHRAIKNFLGTCGIKRIEAAVEVGFENGHRWVAALGFKLEAARMVAYSPDGRDHALYSLVGGV